MKMRVALVAGAACLLVAATPGSADQDLSAIVGTTGCGILATLLKNPQLKVAAGGACVYGTSIAKGAVSKLIDDYFDRKDQAFSDKYCLTIIHADGSKIEPKDKTSCS